jgi:hypothetical protein
MIDAAQECRFATARRTEETDDLPLADGKIDTLEDIKRPEGLVDVDCLNHDGGRLL